MFLAMIGPFIKALEPVITFKTELNKFVTCRLL